MRVHGRKLFKAGIALAASLAAFTVQAQETADEFEPAVNTSAVFDEADAGAGSRYIGRACGGRSG